MMNHSSFPDNIAVSCIIFGSNTWCGLIIVQNKTPKVVTCMLVLFSRGDDRYLIDEMNVVLSSLILCCIVT